MREVRSRRVSQDGQASVMARLQALFPAPSADASKKPNSTPGNGPETNSLQSSHSFSLKSTQRQFIKIRILTWNMHDSVPKGDLTELLGSVHSDVLTSLDLEEGTGLPPVCLDQEHPYHIVIVAGQECPSASGIPMALGAGFKLKDKDKDKDKSKESIGGRPDDADRRNPQCHEESSRHSTHLHPEVRDHQTVLHPGESLDHEPQTEARQRGTRQHHLHSHHSIHGHTPGWSSILERWYSNMIPSDRSTKSLPEIAATHSSNTMSAAHNIQPDGCETILQKIGAGPYELITKERLMGIYLAVFVNVKSKHLIQGISKSAVAAGLIGGRVGNKGGVGVSLNINGIRLLFVNAHLAAHESNIQHRVIDFAKIKAELSLDDFLPSDDPRKMLEDVTDRFDHTFVFGDLNFRLNVSRLHADWLISQKEYGKALAFDQLRHLIQSGTAFTGFREAAITFPPTFKYDVLRTIRRPKDSSLVKDSIGVNLQHGKLLSDIEEKYQDSALEDRERSKGEEGSVDPDTVSIASTTWTSIRSRYTIGGDATDQEQDEMQRLHSPVANIRSGNLAKRLWTSATASKTKVKWLERLTPANRHPSGRGGRKLEQKPHGPSLPASVSGNHCSSHSSTLLVEPARAEIDIKNNADSRHRQAEDAGRERILRPEDKGVYDSSHKQRVPSWCDRILWKSTVEPEPDIQEADLSYPPRTRVSSFLHAFRPTRSRIESGPSASLLDSLPTASPYTNTPVHYERPSSETFATARMSRPRSIESLPAPTQSQQSPSELQSRNRRPQRRLSLDPSVVTSVPLIHSQTMPVMTTSPSSPLDILDSPHVTTPPISSRWLGFIPFLRRDTPAYTKSQSNSPQTPDVSVASEAPQPRRGDVVCLGYHSLDDSGMRRLEGRSDHRPVIGTFAIYV